MKLVEMKSVVSDSIQKYGAYNYLIGLLFAFFIVLYLIYRKSFNKKAQVYIVFVLNYLEDPMRFFRSNFTAFISVWFFLVAIVIIVSLHENIQYSI